VAAVLLLLLPAAGTTTLCCRLPSGVSNAPLQAVAMLLPVSGRSNPLLGADIIQRACQTRGKQARGHGGCRTRNGPGTAINKARVEELSAAGERLAASVNAKEAVT